MPRISVIIPTYNREKLLPRALDSVLNQSEQDFEILVIDDASTDDTEALVCERYGSDARLRYIRLQQNGGVDNARNKGLDVARGEFVAFLDSDDEYLPDALSRACAALASYGLVFAPYRLTDGTLSGFEWKEGEVSAADFLCERGARKRKAVCTFVRRSEIGSLRWETRYLQALWYHYIAAKTRVYYLTEPLGIYHLDLSDAQSITNVRRKPNAGLSKERGRVLEKFLETLGPGIVESCPKRYSYYAYGAAVGLLLAGETEHARRFARDAARYQSRLRYRTFYWFSLVPGSPVLLAALFKLAEAFYVS